MVQPFSPEDIYLHTKITDIDCSRNENLAACSVVSLDPISGSETSNLWIFSLQGDMPWKMTTGSSLDNTPRWSPDGNSLGFVSDRSGRNQVFVVPRHGGESRQPAVLDGVVVTFEWSPDCKRLAIICSIQVDPELRGQRPAPGSNLPEADAPKVVWKLPYKVDGIGFTLDQEMHLFVCDVSTGESRQITDGPFDVRSLSWSQDGKQIVYTRTREGDESHRTDVWIIDADGNNACQLSTEQSQALYPVCSPDGRWMVFSGTVAEGDAQVRLWRVDMASGQVKGLGSESIEISTEGDSVQFAGGDSTHVLALVARRGIHEVTRIGVLDGELTVIASGERQLSKLACTSSYMAFISETPVCPNDLYCCRVDGSGERRLSDLNPWWRERTGAVMERRIFEVDDGDVGAEVIDGWLIRPAGVDSPTPLLVDVHGGPASYVLFNYLHAAYWPVLWSRGWSILALNAVGSASYGRSFAERLRGHWGELDLPQHQAAVGKLQADGLVNDAVAIAGKSYGGYMSAWAVGHTRQFKAAIVIAPVANIDSHYGVSDSGYYSDPYALAADPERQRDTMRRLSPAEHAHLVVTPTLILQGSDDERCPRSQAEEFYVRMKRGQSPPCELVLYPGTHQFTNQGKPSHRQDVVRRIVDWLARWTH